MWASVVSRVSKALIPLASCVLGNHKKGNYKKLSAQSKGSDFKSGLISLSHSHCVKLLRRHLTAYDGRIISDAELLQANKVGLLEALPAGKQLMSHGFDVADFAQRVLVPLCDELRKGPADPSSYDRHIRTWLYELEMAKDVELYACCVSYMGLLQDCSEKKIWVASDEIPLATAERLAPINKLTRDFKHAQVGESPERPLVTPGSHNYVITSNLSGNPFAECSDFLKKLDQGTGNFISEFQVKKHFVVGVLHFEAGSIKGVTVVDSFPEGVTERKDIKNALREKGCPKGVEIKVLNMGAQPDSYSCAPRAAMLACYLHEYGAHFKTAQDIERWVQDVADCAVQEKTRSRRASGRSSTDSGVVSLGASDDEILGSGAAVPKRDGTSELELDEGAIVSLGQAVSSKGELEVAADTGPTPEYEAFLKTGVSIFYARPGEIIRSWFDRRRFPLDGNSEYMVLEKAAGVSSAS